MKKIVKQKNTQNVQDSAAREGAHRLSVREELSR
jgi:hypothetical protein